MNLLGYLLSPFSLLYGAVVFVRNKFYDYGILPSRGFAVPIILVGNLSVGGTGKTPHVEYILRVLSRQYRVAVLSRGYGRKTKGWLLANSNSTALETGDEPQQYIHKFKNALVAVDEDRVHGVSNLLMQQQVPDVIVLDDAYQHRALKAGFSILLTDYNLIYCNDRLLPWGRLRESPAGAERATAIIITKTPAHLTAEEQRNIIIKIKPLPTQQVYFTYLCYGILTPLFKAAEMNISDLKGFTAIVLTGIANPQPLLSHLQPQLKKLLPVTYPDHHVFTTRQLQSLIKQFNSLGAMEKIIITTEKDAMRLRVPELARHIAHLPIYYLPVEIAFHGNGAEFDKQIVNFITSSMSKPA